MTKIIRHGLVRDINKVWTLIDGGAKLGHMLPKSRPALMTMLPNMVVIEINGEVASTASTKIWCTGEVEIISVVTDPGHRENGYATEAVSCAIKNAISFGFNKIVVMAVKPNFFSRLGFIEYDYRLLPAKLWSDCANCNKNAANPGDKKCNEICMMLKV